MSNLKHFFTFYIYSNIHVSIAAYCLTKITLFEYNIENNTIPVFAFSATIVSYNFIRFYRINEINRSAANWMRSNKVSLILTNIFAFILLASIIIKIRPKNLILLSPFVLATILYVIPFSKKKLNLRSVAGLKLFLIAFTWAGITVLFPLSYHELGFSNDVWISFVQRFLILIALTIPFDIRDVDHDNPEIRTLPQTIGIKNSKFVGSAALLLFLMFEMLRIPNEENTIIVTLIIAVLSFLFLIFAGKNQSKYYCSFWVESIPILWYLIIVFTSGLALWVS
jgi:hypothetical protein